MIYQIKQNHTINSHYGEQYPIRLLKFVLKKLKLRELFSKYVKDPRSRVDCYDLTFLLMHGLLTHLFRSPSKHKFAMYLLRPSAARAIAKFNGDHNHCPCIRTLDDVLVNLNPEDFQPILPAIFRSLCRGKVFQLHPEFIPQGEYAIAIDAQVIHVYREHSQHPSQCCPYCLKRTRGNKTWYVHCDLVASFVAPNGLQIPLLSHRIRARHEWGQLPEKSWKQECERTAFPVLLRQLKHYFPRLPMCIHLDALYATDANFTLLEELGFGYSIVRKAKVLKTVGEDCKGLRSLCKPVQIDREHERFKIHQVIHFFNDIPYRQHKLSIIELDETAQKKPSKRLANVTSKKTHWEWIVHKHLRPSDVGQAVTRSRIRWKQEELFNDLQHRGFAICHDFNRAPTAQLIRTSLILIAYAICSILTYSQQGQSILSKGMTVRFMMEQMLLDLIYRPDRILFTWSKCRQLRWGHDPP
ncbi:MAG: hypothetical protein KC505_03695 [Myxococcales bacterium]|nr:hypothetical protein [Myxococcales bacterium]